MLSARGYNTQDIGKKKVHALGSHLKQINSGLDYRPITKKLSFND